MKPRNALLDELSSSLDIAIPTFILIDPMLGEPPFAVNIGASAADINVAREQAWERHVQPIELDKRVQLSTTLHPYLVLLKGPDDPLLEVSLELAQAEREETQADGLEGNGTAAHRIGGWLQSSLQPQQLAILLSEMFRVNTDAHTQATYLRLADRRVLDLLRHVVGDERVTSQFGRLQRWIYLDGQGRLNKLFNGSKTVSSLRLSKKEWHDMGQGEVLHRTLACWMGEIARSGNVNLSQYRAFELFERVRKATSAAERVVVKWPYRFPTLADKITWAVLTLLYPKVEQAEYALKIAAVMDYIGNEEEPAEPLRYLYSEIVSLMQQD